jgi:hypothetical protein
MCLVNKASMSETLCVGVVCRLRHLLKVAKLQAALDLIKTILNADQRSAHVIKIALQCQQLVAHGSVVVAEFAILPFQAIHALMHAAKQFMQKFLTGFRYSAASLRSLFNSSSSTCSRNVFRSLSTNVRVSWT